MDPKKPLQNNSIDLMKLLTEIISNVSNLNKELQTLKEEVHKINHHVQQHCKQIHNNNNNNNNNNNKI